MGYRGARHGCFRPISHSAFATRQRLFDGGLRHLPGESPLGRRFACPHCGTAGEPFHFENRPGVLRCRKCRKNTGLTVMERSHTPIWFWAAYGRQSDARHVRRAVSAATWSFALRDGLSNPPQAPLGHGAAQPRQDRWTAREPSRWTKRVGGRTRGEGRAPGSRLLCRGASGRAPSSTTGKTDVMPDAFGSPSCPTVAPSRSVGSSKHRRAGIADRY